MPRPLSMAATRDSIRVATAMAGRAHIMADDAFGRVRGWLLAGWLAGCYPTHRNPPPNHDCENMDMPAVVTPSVNVTDMASCVGSRPNTCDA